jgi:hypothetical protein
LNKEFDMANTKLDRFDKANPGVIDKLIHQQLCTSLLDILFDEADDHDNPMSIIKDKRLPEPSQFEKNMVKSLKKNPTVKLYELTGMCKAVNRKLVKQNKGERVGTEKSYLLLYNMVLPKVFAYAQMDQGARLEYVTNVLQEIAKKPKVTEEGRLAEDHFRAYAWLHPDEFVYCKDEYGSNELQVVCTSDNDAAKQKLLKIMRRPDELLCAVCTVMDHKVEGMDAQEGESLISDFCGDFYDTLLKLPVSLRKAMGLPVTDPTFRLFKEHFTEDKAAAFITHKDETVRELSALVMEHGTDKMTTILKEYFKDCAKEDD